MIHLLILTAAAFSGAPDTSSLSLPSYRIEDIAGGGARLTVDQKSVSLTRDQAADLRKRLSAAGATQAVADIGHLRTLETDAQKAQDEVESVAKELAHAKEALQNAKRDTKQASNLATAGKKSVRSKNSQLSQASSEADRARERIETLEKSHDKAAKEAAAAKSVAESLRKDLTTRTDAIRKLLSDAVQGTAPAADKPASSLR